MININKKYSVIVPAYNAESTLDRCLESFAGQIRDDIEIILVNDGSKDSTAVICREYAAKYSQVRFIDKENGGVSSARNAGLKAAEGDFVTFVDSDDFVVQEYFSVIDQYLEENCDFLMFGAKQFNGREYVDMPLKPAAAKTEESVVELLSAALCSQKLNSPWNKVFRRSIIENKKIRFDERLPIGEDKVFVVQYVLNAKNIMFIPEMLYCFSMENENSLSRRTRPNLCSSIILEHELMFDSIERADLSPSLCAKYEKAISWSYYRSAYTVISEIRKLNLSKKERIAKTREICRTYARRRNCRLRNLKHWLMALPVRLRLAGIIDAMLCKRYG